MEDLTVYHEIEYYGVDDIAEKLPLIAGLEDMGPLEKELLESLYQLKAMAANPYNCDRWRILYNVLLEVAGTAIF